MAAERRFLVSTWGDVRALRGLLGGPMPPDPITGHALEGFVCVGVDVRMLADGKYEAAARYEKRAN